MDIAVRYEKIDLGYDKFLFKPVGIIKGIYNKESNTFETDYGEICSYIGGESKYGDSYFGALTSLEQLKTTYTNVSEEYLLTQFYDECSLFCTIGYYDYKDTKIKLVHIPYEELEDQIMQHAEEKLQEELAKEIETEPIPEKEMMINFTVDNLKELRNSKDIKEVREKLDSILNFASMLSGNFIDYVDGDSGKIEEENDELPVKNENKDSENVINLRGLRKEVKDVIKGQDKAVDDVTRAILINETSKNPRHKSHMLIMGPSGTGKTEMINIISKKIGIPYFKADATAYTKDGYVGKSVYSMIVGLINAAGGDIEKAQKGILIIDEIDKKLTSEEDWVGGVEVLNSLLKIMDRDIVEIDLDSLSKKKILFDTSNLTIIFMGAFAKLYEQKSKSRVDKKTIGFNCSIKEEKTKEKISLTNADLIKAGMPPEFLGRISVITNTEELELEDLVEILYKSKGSAIEEEIEFCAELGITLKFTNPYIREIATKAKENKTGARTLRKLVRESLTYAYDEILSGKKVKVLKLTKETVHDPKKYYTE